VYSLNPPCQDRCNEATHYVFFLFTLPPFFFSPLFSPFFSKVQRNREKRERERERATPNVYRASLNKWLNGLINQATSGKDEDKKE